MYNNHFAVITPYYKEDPALIDRAIKSVESQHPSGLVIKHYLVSDGHPIEINNKEIIHLVLPQSHGDFGDTPRMMGATLAVRQGCRGLMFLDADNIIHPSHILSAYKARQQTECNIIVARRDVLGIDGSKLAYPPEDQSLEHVDTGCFIFFEEAVYDALDWIKIPREYSVIGDRYFWKMIRTKRKQVAVLQTATVGYTSLWKSNYLSSNINPPENAKNLDLSDYEKFIGTLTTEERLMIKKRLFPNL